MGALSAPLILVAARARRRPSRWLLPIVGLALAAAFACAIAAEGTITGDRAARAVLTSIPVAQRAVTVTWQGPPPSATANRQARGLLDGLGLSEQTRIVLLNPVRLDGALVRPAAILPLSRWVTGAETVGLGRCRAASCPMLLVSRQLKLRRLSSAGVSITLAGRGTLASAAPLGFTPSGSASPPVLVNGDPTGLAAISGLAGVYRTESWLAVPALGRLHSWQLRSLQRRLQTAQAKVLQESSDFSLSAPFVALQEASARASDAPRRLALAGGGALAALAMFLILAAYGLRSDERDELSRLRAAGARSHQSIIFALAEAGWLSAAGLLAGAALGVTAAAVLASAAGLPAGAVLSHSLITGTGAVVLLGGWVAATALIGCVLLLPGGRAADVLAVAAVAALALALSRGATTGGTLALLMAPLACIAAGAIVYRLAGAILRTGERVLRRGPVAMRLAIVGLARAPTAPALAVAFIAVSIGLAGFALGYRATLQRGAADQAAQSVPLDARIVPSPGSTTPLQVAPLSRWRALAGGGTVLPVRRTYASYEEGGAANSVPALGVPAAGLRLIHAWPSDGGSASAAVLAHRLAPRGPVSRPGPSLAAGDRSLRLRMSAPAGVEVTADLLSADGALLQVPLGLAAVRQRSVTVRLPPGTHRLEAFELDEPSGEASTNAHQLAESQAAVTQSTSTVTLGPVWAVTRAGAARRVSLHAWRGVGAAGTLGGGTGPLRVLFTDSGAPGIVRPPQPSDSRPVPVVVDPVTAGAATSTGQLTLNVDNEPVTAQVVGTLRRFPTTGTSGNGFVIADESTLAGALNASLPGQGRPDELWIATSAPASLPALARASAGGDLGVSLRADVQRALRNDPTANGVLGGLFAAAAVAAALAMLGLLVALAGAMRQPRAEHDLEAQGLGPRQLRNELGLRVLAAGALGTLAGVVVAGVLTHLAVATVQAAGSVAAPDPPLTAVAPLAQLLELGLLALVAFAALAWLATRLAVARRRPS